MKKLKTRRFEYQILINRRVVWRGSEPKKPFDKLSKKYPKAEMGIKWVPKEGILIAKIQM